ncbi:MAG: hypothetical protein COW30_18830 [Rhodospirillales bacterium CG15_BIG_FIL_POST_REV_8_21_14_020_66_15]|nr:MAG: hypothetical protein COW30_18830 [Rhodospirillales bacterium CG15_BIG_FIL_POST_REV_8_21_14_020_66_15]
MAGSSVRRILFYLGWALLLAAFAAGAAEGLVRADPGRGLHPVSAHDLWYRLWPGNLVVTQIRVERLSPELWSAVVRPVLDLPAWILTGLPGVLLTWLCRPRRTLTPDEEQDLREREESMFLYDELAARAREDGHVDDDDMAPSHESQHFLDEAGLTHADSEEDYDIDMDGLPPPRPDGR